MVCERPELLTSRGQRDDEEPPEQEPDDTPETPTDEPRPPKVEDPPAEPGEKGPFVVSAW